MNSAPRGGQWLYAYNYPPQEKSEFQEDRILRQDQRQAPLYDAGLDFPLNAPAQRPPSLIQITPGLQVDPELWRNAEILAESKRSISGNRPPAEYDVVDARARRFDCLCERVNADRHWDKKIIT